MAGRLQPLDQKFRIADENGNPTEYFIRWAQQRQIDIGDSITLADLKAYLTLRKLVEGSGIQITPPSGDLNDGPLTIAADSQEILDQITSTRGSILYRGLLGWTGLGPGPLGQFLQSSGPGADPVWAVAGGGGGGAATLIQQGRFIGGTATVTMPAAPTAGNLLICLATHWNSSVTPQAPWTQIRQTNGASTDGLIALVCVVTSALAGSATIPAMFSAPSSCMGAVFEVAGGIPIQSISYDSFQEIVASTRTLSTGNGRANALAIGIAATVSANVAPVSIGGGVTIDGTLTGVTVNASPRQVTSFSKAALPAASALDCLITYAAAPRQYGWLYIIEPI